jgi:hypothetical protein
MGYRIGSDRIRSTLHSLEVVTLPDLGLPILPQRLAELLPLRGGEERARHRRRRLAAVTAARKVGGEVDGLRREGDVGDEGLEVARG